MWNTLKRWYHQLGSPRYFYRFCEVVVPWLWVIALATLAVGLIWGLLFAPPDYQQGNSYRIIFIHVPASSGALMGYMALGVAGFVAVVWRMKMAEVMLKAIAPFGMMLCAISLVTGGLWGKPTWGTYWQWDARMTSMLILLFLYMGVVALQVVIRDPRQAARAAGLLAMVGTINVFIVRYSVEWVQTLHQGRTLRVIGESAIDPSMKYPLLISMFGLWLLYALNVLIRARAEVLSRERRTGWVKKLIQQESR